MYQKPQLKHIENEVLFPLVKQLLLEGRDATLTPQGNSMQPFIRGGVDTVVLRKMPDVREGDIVLFCLPEEKFILHRLIRVEGEELTFMGDGNLRGEEHCTKADVLGTVVLIRSPKGRHKPTHRWWRLWQWLLPVRWLLLKVDRHAFRHEKFRFYRKWFK